MSALSIDDRNDTLVDVMEQTMGRRNKNRAQATRKARKEKEAAAQSRKRAARRLPASFYWLLFLAVAIYVTIIVLWTQGVDEDITLYTFIGAFPVFGILVLVAVAFYYRSYYLGRT